MGKRIENAVEARFTWNTPGFDAWVTGWGCRGFVNRGTRCRGGVGCRALGF